MTDLTIEQRAGLLYGFKPLPYHTFPNGNGDIMKVWIEQGGYAGSFFEAVLVNDLKGACALADDMNRHLLFEIVQWLYSYAPSDSWGSSDLVREWRKHGGIIGLMKIEEGGAS